MAKKTTKKAIVYARTACVDQGSTVGNLESQLEACRRYAKKKNYKVVGKICGMGSGMSAVPVYFEQLSKICREKGAKTIIALAPNRISRSAVIFPKTVKKLKRLGFNLVFVNGEELNDLNLAVISMLSRVQSIEHGRRIKQSLALLKKKGEKK